MQAGKRLTRWCFRGYTIAVEIRFREGDCEGVAMGNTARIDTEDVLEHFGHLEDPRSSINRQHPLTSVVVTGVMATLTGANGPTAIAKWAKIKRAFLENWLPLPHGIPSKHEFRQVLLALNPEAFQACSVSWLNALRDVAVEATGAERPTFAVDGKTLRRSRDRGKNLGALHSVSIWASELGFTLVQVATEEKSNEITAIPRAFELVDLKGAIVTIDAMGTQTAIAQQIVEGEGDCILALKGNRGTLYEAAVDYLDQQASNDFRGIEACRLETTEKAHGRTETRT
jgi:predicted transposase YbfD/YdcC